MLCWWIIDCYTPFGTLPPCSFFVPPTLLLTICRTHHLVLDVAYALIPRTMPQNLAHYHNFFIFYIVNVVLALYTSKIGGSGK